MEIKYISFMSSNKINTIHGVCWLPKIKYKGIIHILHGMADRIGRYDETAEFFVNQGFIVCGHDQIGHGDSIVDELGFIPNLDGYLNLVEDTKLFQEKIISEYPNLPYFILGHSMGSSVAKIFVSLYPDNLQGLILSGSNYQAKGIGVAILITKHYMKKNGIKAKATEVDKLAFQDINKRFAPARTVSDWLSRDAKQVDKFVNDPKCCFLFSNIAYLNMLYLIRLAGKRKVLKKIPKKMPIYIFSGSEDVSNKLGEGSKKLYYKLKRLGCEKVDIKIYQDGRHEMLNEINKEEVCTDLLKWIEKNVDVIKI